MYKKRFDVQRAKQRTHIVRWVFCILFSLPSFLHSCLLSVSFFDNVVVTENLKQGPTVVYVEEGALIFNMDKDSNGRVVYASKGQIVSSLKNRRETSSFRKKIPHKPMPKLDSRAAGEKMMANHNSDNHLIKTNSSRVTTVAPSDYSKTIVLLYSYKIKCIHYWNFHIKILYSWMLLILALIVFMLSRPPPTICSFLQVKRNL